MKTLLLLLLPLFSYSQVDSIPLVRIEIFLQNDSTAMIQVTKPENVSDESVKEILDLFYSQQATNKRPRKRKEI